MNRIIHRALALLACLLALPVALAASASFTADTTTNFVNPERGWYYEISGAEWCNGTLESIRDGGSSAGNENVRLFLYRWAPGSSLTTLSNDLACVRNAGVKVIMTPVYCNVQFCNEGVTISQAETHMANAAATFKANRDVIYAFRMGIIGAWGEWADSGAGLDTAANKVRVRDAFFNNTPVDIPIVARKPWDIMAWYASPVSANLKFSGSAQSRVGFYNDCFMASADDGFSYPGATTVVDLSVTSTSDQQRDYAIGITDYAPSGGETCNQGGGERLNCGAPDYTAAANDNTGRSGGIMNEGPRYHLAFLNRGYDTRFHDTWISQGCYSTVRNRMGYRFEFVTLTHSDTVSRGGTLTVLVTMRNVGWSRIFSQRRLQVQLVNGGTTITCNSATQLRELPPQASSSTPIQVRCAIPGGTSTGSYTVHLKMPDAYSTTQGNLFTIRPANANSGGQTWDATNYRFTTGTTVTVN